MKYVKKPVVIEAFQLGVDVIPEWAFVASALRHASTGDFIIKGENCPWKEDIFKETHDAVEEDNRRQQMKYTFETEDAKEALLALDGPKFFRALEGIEMFIRNKEKHSDSSFIEISILREKIKEIIYEYAPSFYEVI